MLVTGRTDEGSSRLPTRTTLNCGRTEVLAKRWVPQRGQNWHVTELPLAAVRVNSESAPATVSPSAFTSMFTVPLAARCWQSRHQQTRVVSGSLASVKRTSPHRQRPDRSVMGLSLCG
jgi:hypothetical protein